MSDIPFTPPVPQDSEYQQGEGRPQIQVMAGAPAIKTGCIALVLHNVPISPVQFPDGTEVLVPCIQLTAREAMEVAMNIIYVAKVAENFERERDGN